MSLVISLFKNAYVYIYNQLKFFFFSFSVDNAFMLNTLFIERVMLYYTYLSLD
jgi:hypothetical protein